MNRIFESFNPVGEISVPSSFRYAHRHLIAAYITNKPVTIKNVYLSEDTRLTLECLRVLGGQFEENGNDIKFIKRFKSTSKQIILNIGHCTSALRLLIPLASSLYPKVRFIGDEKLINSSLEIYEDLFKLQGIKIIRNKNVLDIHGTLSPIDMSVRGDVSSDFISGLLFLFGISRSNNTIYLTTQASSKNYILMTLETLKRFGYEFDVTESSFRFKQKADISQSDFNLEPDYSFLAYYAALGCLKGKITIKNCAEESLQGDRIIIDTLKYSQGKVSQNGNDLTFEKSEMRPLDVDVTNCIDLFPVFSIVAAVTKGTSKISGIKGLSSQGAHLVSNTLTELQKMDIGIKIEENCVLITGRRGYQASHSFNSHNDYRILMAMSVLTIAINSRCVLENIDCIKTAYQDFYPTLEGLKVK